MNSCKIYEFPDLTIVSKLVHITSQPVSSSQLCAFKMGKRLARALDGPIVPRKRLKVVHEAPTSEEVQTSKQLQHLLSFTPDSARARHGMYLYSCRLLSLSASPIEMFP